MAGHLHQPAAARGPPGPCTETGPGVRSAAAAPARQEEGVVGMRHHEMMHMRLLASSQAS